MRRSERAGKRRAVVGAGGSRVAVIPVLRERAHHAALGPPAGDRAVSSTEYENGASAYLALSKEITLWSFMISRNVFRELSPNRSSL